MDVYDYLIRVTGEDTFYLRPLNLDFDTGDITNSLIVFRDLGIQLGTVKDGYVKLLDDDNWRSHLIAYTCAVCLDDDTVVPAIKKRFENGSMVAPQLAVALFRLDRDECLGYFTWYLNNPAYHNKSSNIGAILGVLSAKVTKFNMPSLTVDPDLLGLGLTVARRHLAFWGEHLGYNRPNKLINLTPGGADR